MGLVHGCVADDFTGAIDLAGNLAGRGIRTVVTVGAEGAAGPFDPDVEAVVVALKTRTAPPAVAVDESMRAFRALRDAGATQLYFKYCSTFDSTPAGNIGPVLDAALALTGGVTVAVPSFPANGRTVRDSHLFVHDQLLGDSPMRHHPLTPMTESDVRVLLSAQGSTAVDAVHLDTVRAGADAVRAVLDARPGPRVVVADAVDDDDLRVLAEATAHLPLVTGGSGLALGFTSPSGASPGAERVIDHGGHRAIVCGSASSRTREQIASAKAAGVAWRKLDPDAADPVGDLVSWARDVWVTDPEAPALVFATDSLDDLGDPDAPDRADRAALVEHLLAETLAGFVANGARRIVAAGGETSGGVVSRLGVRQLRVGQAIAPGVSWAEARTATGIDVSIALKSGNFGSVDFFTDAWEALR